MLELKLLIVAICAALFWWGGYSWHDARRFIMPLLLAISCLTLTHSLWALTMLTASGALCLGYGDKSPLRHCFGDGWGRGIWGLLVALCFSLGLCLSGYLHWYFLIGYLVLSFTLENALKKLDQKIGDPIIGATFGAIVLLIS